MSFPTDYASILSRVENIDPVAYSRTRNFSDGAVTKLSPYISRGVISTKKVLASVLLRGYEPSKMEKFIQELAWRDYWQQIWKVKGELINADLKRTQPNVVHHEVTSSIINGETGIQAIDGSILELVETGYMHNHMRMYVAALACNLSGAHWKNPAKWMYYHLLDGDWASNALSWQWVAGANANKKYYANQDNINKYWYSNQQKTFLDVPYESFQSRSVPGELQSTQLLDLKTDLSNVKSSVSLDDTKPTLIYTSYNLDPLWKKGEDANKVLLLEPSIFGQYPISDKVLNFVVNLSGNIPGIQVFVGEFSELKDKVGTGEIYYKEHPLSQHFQGVEESRDWMFSVEGYFPSFFAFWKKCKKELKYAS